MTVAWTEAFSSFTPAGTGWQNYDLYTNKSVPKGAIALILIGSVNDAAARTVGVRIDGSALNRYIKLHESEAGGATTATMFVKSDVSAGLIETYCDSTTGITFYLLGYWTGVDFTEMITDISSGSASTWTDSDIYTNQSVPKGRVVQLLLANFNDGAAATVGVRTNGSGNARYRALHEAESASAEYTDCECYSICVLSNASDGIIELWRSDATYGKQYLLGYFGAELTYVESAPVAGAITSASTWTDWDLTGSLDQDGRIVEVVCGHSTTNAEHDCGARINGSGLARYVLIHEAESNGEVGATFVTRTDSNGIIEIYCSTASAEQFDFIGYFKGETNERSFTIGSQSRFRKEQSITISSQSEFAVALVTREIYATSQSRFKKTFEFTITAQSRFRKEQSITISSQSRFLVLPTVTTQPATDIGEDV